MRRLILLLGFALVMVLPGAAYAQSLVGSSTECGTYSFHEDLTKGRTDSLVMHARHTEGCFTYDYTNLAPAGIGEAQGNAWQQNYCVQEGQKDVANHFRWYRGLTIDPSTVKISCKPYNGPD